MKEKNKFSKQKSLYLQISKYVGISIIIGLFVFFSMRNLGSYILVRTNYMNQSVQDKLDSAFVTLKSVVTKNEDSVYDALDDWTYSNKYYVLYLMDKQGVIYYTNDNFYERGETEVSFPTEKLYNVTVGDEELNVYISYLFTAEMSTKVETVSIISSFVVAILLFIFLFKKIVDRIKLISYQLEVVSGGDSNILILDNKHDEIGALVRNINQMRSSLMKQYDQVETLENTHNQRIAVLSHDIRTPLTIIRGYLEIIRSVDNIDEIKKYLNKFEEKVIDIQHLSSELFNNISATTENNSIEEKKTMINYAMLLSELAEFKAGLELMGFKVNLVSSHSFQSARIEIYKFRQIITNIHTNIINYADRTKYININCVVHEDFLSINITNHVDLTLRSVSPSSKQGLILQRSMMESLGGNLMFETKGEEYHTIIEIPLN